MLSGRHRPVLAGCPLVIAAVVTALALAALNIYLGVGYLKIEAFWNRWRGANFVEPEWKLPGWIEHKKDYPTSLALSPQFGVGGCRS